MVLYIYFKGLSLKAITKHLGYKQKWTSTFAYSSADVYFSAITPSATGGQPASAYYMVKDGIPISTATAVLSFNIFMYIASLVVMAVITFAFRFNLFLSLDFLPKIFVLAGVAVQSVFLIFFLLVMGSQKLVLRLGKFAVNILFLLHVFKDKEKAMERLTSSVSRFKVSIKLIGDNKKLALEAFLLNMLERISVLSISVLVFFGAGLRGASVIDVYALQAYCMLGSNCVPLPGSVGVSEGLYLSAFSGIIDSATLVSAMLATRGISYYICFMFAGAVTLIHHIKISFVKK